MEQDPDPYQNETDPKHCFVQNRIRILTLTQKKNLMAAVSKDFCEFLNHKFQNTKKLLNIVHDFYFNQGSLDQLLRELVSETL